MRFERIQSWGLPDGSIGTLFPFHISFEGMESVLMCRDEEDYDVLQKTFYVCTWKENIYVVSDVEMSNHGHMVVLARSFSYACKAAVAIKKNYSQYFSRKYREHNSLMRSDVKVIYLDSDRYLRNALAYVPRNALDACSDIGSYRWSSYRAMFSSLSKGLGTPVSQMSRREKEAVFHTHAYLDGTTWEVDASGFLIPQTACMHAYAERAFFNDQAYFLRTVGSINCGEMEQKLILGPRTWRNDSEMRKAAEELVRNWFESDLSSISLEKKARILPYLYHNYKTSVAQLARCIGLTKEETERFLQVKKRAGMAQV